MNKILLRDRVDFMYGFATRVDDEPIGNYPIFGSNGITGYIDSYKVNGPGVIIGRKGTVGAVNYSAENFTPTDTAFYLSIKDATKDNIDFWFYYLQYLRLDKLNTHSSVPGLSREIAYQLSIAPPGLKEQKDIAQALRKIDKKIELNNQINKELDAMAKLVFDYWFLQFDFPAQNGKPYKSSGGRLVWNPALKREIPEGWDSLPVKDLLEKERPTTKIPTSEMLEEGEIPVIDQGDDFIAGYTNDISAKIIIDNAKIVFGDHTRKLKLINFPFARGADGTQVITSSNNRMPQHLFFMFLREIDLSTYGYARHFKFLKESIVVLPSEEVSKKYEAFASKIFKKISKNIFENRELLGLRNWLMPLLINAQVRLD